MAINKRLIKSNDEGGGCLDPFGDQTQLALYKFNNTVNDETGDYNFSQNTTSYTTGEFNEGLQMSNFTYVRNSGLTNGLPLSFSFWYYPVTTPVPLGLLINKRVGFNGFSITSGYSASDGKPYMIANNSTSFPVGPILLFPNANVWYHVVISMTTSSIAYFLNGAANVSGSGGFTNNTTADLWLGHIALGNWNGAAGRLDQLRVFNRTLDQTEANYLYTTDSACG